jgi:hypothetical protein
MVDVSHADFQQLAKSVEELSVQVIALTALVGEMVTAASVDFERLEDCVQFAANRLRPGRRPLLFAKAALVLEDFEVMQRALRIETRKIRNRRRPPPKH